MDIKRTAPASSRPLSTAVEYPPDQVVLLIPPIPMLSWCVKHVRFLILFFFGFMAFCSVLLLFIIIFFLTNHWAIGTISNSSDRRRVWKTLENGFRDRIGFGWDCCSLVALLPIQS